MDFSVILSKLIQMEIENPAFDYESFGQHYPGRRRTDIRIFHYIRKALGDAKTVLNVGAGAGSYEPSDRYVVALEPSAVMRAQRDIQNKFPAVIGSADNLPFDDNAFDASMAILTVHHWPDMQKGLQELRRVTKHQVVVMTFDPDSLHEFWNAEYFPDVIEVEKRRYPTIDFIKEVLGGNCEVQKIPIPFDCTDGFQEAFYGRPDAFLEDEIRRAQSAWGFLPEGVEAKLIEAFRKELESGEWDRKYGHFRRQETFLCALRLVVSS
jgi:SAM-dependent methyltransferase